MGLIIGKGINISGAVDIQFEYPILPTNTVLPLIAGNINRDSTLTTTTGDWTGIPNYFSYAYQWQRGTSNIAGANANTYVLVTADIGSTIRSAITATSGSGSTIAYSLNTSPILPALPNAPTNIVPVSYNSTTASLTWTAPTDNGGGTITSYQIIATRLNGAGTVTATVTGPTSGNISGLVTGGLYEFSVAATNAAGTGPYGQSVSSIYIVPAILEFYAGGYVVIASPGSAVIVSPTAGGTSGGNFTTCNNFCNSLVLNGYSDWVVPTRDTLTAINTYKSGLSITPGTYWSSTLQAGAFPIRYYVRDFPSGTESVQDATSSFLSVRATRTAFYP